MGVKIEREREREREMEPGVGALPCRVQDKAARMSFLPSTCFWRHGHVAFVSMSHSPFNFRPPALPFPSPPGLSKSSCALWSAAWATVSTALGKGQGLCSYCFSVAHVGRPWQCLWSAA